MKTAQELLKEHLDYLEYLKQQLPNAGINYAKTQQYIRQTRAIIADLRQKIDGMTVAQRRKATEDYLNACEPK